MYTGRAAYNKKFQSLLICMTTDIPSMMKLDEDLVEQRLIDVKDKDVVYQTMMTCLMIQIIYYSIKTVLFFGSRIAKWMQNPQPPLERTEPVEV